jgi:ribose transport system ATP-binding protein
MAEASAVLEADSVTVAYPGSKALEGVSLSLKSSQIHVLVGQNGAGKSSLIKVMTGAMQPNFGSVKLDGEVVNLRRPADAAKLGVRVVPQEQQLFPRLRVWENIAAPLVDRRFWIESRRRLRSRAREALALLGGTIDADAVVSDLSPAEQQVVAIARAVVERARFLILAEPTAALARDERTVLLDLLRAVAARGVGLLFVSHYLEESLLIADEISVLRDGQLIWTRRRDQVDESSLTSAMFGATVERRRLGGRESAQIQPGDAPLLTLRELRWPGVLRTVDLDLFGGQIVGVAGLPGSGANTLNRAILGVSPRKGTIAVEGDPVTGGLGGAFRAGFGYIPAERKSQALFIEMSVLDNMCAADLKRYSANGVLKGRQMLETSNRLVSELGVVTPSTDSSVAQLSGGNQQKVVVGRWLGSHIRVLLADEPTRGVDVAARLQIHLLLQEIANRGGVCLVYSSDLEELVDISDSIVLFHRDRTARLIDADLTAQELYDVMSEIDSEGM